MSLDDVPHLVESYSNLKNIASWVEIDSSKQIQPKNTKQCIIAHESI